MRYVGFGLCLLMLGCGHAPTTPTLLPADTAELDYDINLPTLALTSACHLQYPEGVRMAPITASVVFDYTQAYGSPNVYWGPGAPTPGTSAGLLSAPVAVAQQPFFYGRDWPELDFSPNQQIFWVGRCVYTPPTPDLR